MNILIEPSCNWHQETRESWRWWWIGDSKAVSQIVDFCFKNRPLSSDRLASFLNGVPGFFGLLIDGNDFQLGCADKLRSYPLFYAIKNKKIALSSSARFLKKELDLNERNELAWLEMNMAGYVTGRETLYHNLFQIQAGEFIFKNDRNPMERRRYYIFFSSDTRTDSEANLIEELESTTNKIFKRIIEDVKGAPIWVPLSGGLDSRLILYKLKEFNYDNLFSFSYGPPGNLESKVAKEVAEKLGVRWQFVSSNRDRIRSFFWSDERRKYWEFADGLYVVPNIHWIDSLKYFLDHRLIPKDAVLINGQTGDFIAGNHIPTLSPRAKVDAALLFHHLIRKHFALQENLLADQTIAERIKAKIHHEITSNVTMDYFDEQLFAKYLELWEWQERQCKRVLNGQRTYDFYGLSWKLPLWEEEYLRFWSTIPLCYKKNRSLFIRYTEQMDRVGVFRNYKPVVHRWPEPYLFISYLGKVTKLVLGAEASRKFYKYMDYFSLYSSLYAPFTYREYAKSCQNYRGPFPLFGKVYQDELAQGLN